MNNLMVDVTGYAAATIGTVLMLPQVMKARRTKKVDDLSVFMLTLYLVGAVLWDLYGFALGSMPIIICNAVAFCIGAYLAFLKFHYGRRPIA